MKIQLLCCTLLLPLFIFSQNVSKFGRTYSDTLPENFKLNTTQLRDHIYNGIPAKIKDELYPRTAYQFADQSAVFLSYLFSSGTIYSDWPALEKYINDVVDKVMPPELAGDTVIHAYLVKDGTYNAFMSPFGIMMVHVGLLDEVPNEAALAAVLSHELAHYYLQHSLEEFVKENRGDFEKILLKTSRSKFSIENELQADSLCIAWMHRAGYSIKGVADAFSSIQRLENKWLLQHEYIWERTETTHPTSDKRLAQVEKFRQNHPEETEKLFIVNQLQFFKLRELAKSETLKHLLNDLAYDDCIEKAFKFHILNPKKPEYVYYLMEGIRRKCYFNVDYWKRKFITDRYFRVISSNNSRVKKPITDHIFKTIPAEILCLTQDEIDNLPGHFYWEGEVKFETYEEAFDFFYQIGELYKEPECILSNALSISNKPEVKKQLLEKYLSNEKIQFRSYATALLGGSLQSNLPEKTLTMIGDFSTVIRQGNEEILLRSEKLVDDDNLTPVMEAAVAGFPQRKYLNISTLQGTRINDYVLLQELRKLALMKFVAKGEKTELDTIDPRYWQIMEKYGVNELEFVDFNYYDSRKSSTELEDYKTAIHTDINDLFGEVKRNRYIQTRISAIREVPQGVMKVQHIGYEEKIDFKAPGKGAVIEYLNRHLKQKDKEAADLDEEIFGKKK